MLCSHCGKEIRDGVKFCPFCGTAPASAAPDAAPETEPTRAAVVPPTVAMPRDPQPQYQMPQQPQQPQAPAPQPQSPSPDQTQAAVVPPTVAMPRDPQPQYRLPQYPQQPPYPAPAKMPSDAMTQAVVQTPYSMPAQDLQPQAQAAAKPKGNKARLIAIILLVVALLAAGGFGVWYFVLRDKDRTEDDDRLTTPEAAAEFCIDALNAQDRAALDNEQLNDIYRAIAKGMGTDSTLETAMADYLKAEAFIAFDYLKGGTVEYKLDSEVVDTYDFGAGHANVLPLSKDNIQVEELTDADLAEKYGIKSKNFTVDGREYTIEGSAKVVVPTSEGNQIGIAIAKFDGEWLVIGVITSDLEKYEVPQYDLTTVEGMVALCVDALNKNDRSMLNDVMVDENFIYAAVTEKYDSEYYSAYLVLAFSAFDYFSGGQITLLYNNNVSRYSFGPGHASELPLSTEIYKTKTLSDSLGTYQYAGSSFNLEDYKEIYLGDHGQIELDLLRINGQWKIYLVMPTDMEKFEV
ncbi:MAG: zinc-ribbon domain-containing protein [Clostridia bacterium]|nr:zinc-ribbon domain-containing protein [Clostridia bacterium]